jgi:hypothetical protein
MDELVKTLDRYFEFLILGVLACALVTATVRAIAGRAWHQLAAVPDLRKSDSRVRQAALAGTLFGCLYLTGLVVNLVSIWLLEPAHQRVVYLTHARLAQGEGLQQRDVAFFLRPLPFLRTVEAREQEAYQKDFKLQFRWQLAHRESFEAQLGGALKQLRMLRGLVALSLALALLSFAILVARVLGRARGVPGWFGAAGMLAGCVLYVVGMTIYWEFETSRHHDIWLSQQLIGDPQPGR